LRAASGFFVGYQISQVNEVQWCAIKVNNDFGVITFGEFDTSGR
jgi:hypothetical protein